MTAPASITVHVRTSTGRPDRRINAHVGFAATRCGAEPTSYDVDPWDVRSASKVAALRDWLSRCAEPRSLCPSCVREVSR